MANYSATDKFLHRIYLGNYAIAKAGLELEIILKGQEARKLDVSERVFVTGLARSGTTAVMNQIFKSGEYASLQYSNMPFLLNPNLWLKRSNLSTHERAHNDGIQIDGNSPEEFDEFFWKSHLKDSYIRNDFLLRHEVKAEILERFETYLRLICLAKGKTKYLSKNNNNILRLESLFKLPDHKIILLFREPVAHASSLMKLHLKFSKSQSQDSFGLEYFDYLGHHEFGLHHKRMQFEDHPTENPYSTNELNYWLKNWYDYYSFILKSFKNTESSLFLQSFEELIQNPPKAYQAISTFLSVGNEIESGPAHQPQAYKTPECDPDLLKKCNKTYSDLLELTEYQRCRFN